MHDVVIVSGMRTAIGTFGGSLKDTPVTELATTAVKAALERAQLKGADVDQVVMGHVVNTEPKDLYLSRVAALNAGCDQKVTAFNVNRLCGSGLQALVCAAQSIMLGDTQIAVAEGLKEHNHALAGLIRNQSQFLSVILDARKILSFAPKAQ
jgi:acetyl-CoA C-acetyltransferase